MSTKKLIKVYYDIGSPYSYVALKILNQYYTSVWAQLIDIHLEPILVGGIFKETGNHAPMEIPYKRFYQAKDMIKTADWADISMKIPDGFPISSLKAMRLLTAAKMICPENLWKISFALFESYWTNSGNIADIACLQSAIDNAGISQGTKNQIFEHYETQKVKEALKNNTSNAVEMGAFGVPVFAIPYSNFKDEKIKFMEPKHPSGYEIFFGVDRLAILAHCLDLPFYGPLNNITTSGHESKL